MDVEEANQGKVSFYYFYYLSIKKSIVLSFQMIVIWSPFDVFSPKMNILHVFSRITKDLRFRVKAHGLVEQTFHNNILVTKFGE